MAPDDLLESTNADDQSAGFDQETFAAIGVPVAAVFRAIDQLRGLLEDETGGVPPALVDAAFLQAHMLGVAQLIADAGDEASDEARIAAFAEQLRNTVPIARIL